MNQQSAQKRVQKLLTQAQEYQARGDYGRSKMLRAEAQAIAKSEMERFGKLAQATTRSHAIKRRIDAMWMLFPKAMTLSELAQACPKARPLIAEFEHLEHEAA